jgi:hypothetical protein
MRDIDQSAYEILKGPASFMMSGVAFNFNPSSTSTTILIVMGGREVHYVYNDLRLW